LTHGCNAHLVPPGDADGMAGAIRSIIADGEYARNLGLAARRDVAAFTWNKRARAIVGRFCNAAATAERALA